jgi:histidine ammonia-lyase
VKLRQVVTNAEQVLAIELLAAAEGLDYRAPLRSSKPIERAREVIRGIVPRLIADRPLSGDIEKMATAIQRGDFDEFMLERSRDH